MARHDSTSRKRIAIALLLAVAAAGCRTTPLTGRRQLLLVPEQQEISMGLAAYEEATKSEKPSGNAHYVTLVNRVGQRIAVAANRPDYQWEFRVVASPDKNAFCLPGGKVAVYEGIMPICANEAGLAVVMSHEIAHALARHGGERMSQNMAVEGVRNAVDYFTRDREQRQRELILQAYGLGSRYGVILPYSRKHELEADYMGLVMMAQAGYDPAEAPRFWQRFAAVKDSGKVPEFLSTHPSDARRADDLLAKLPEVAQEYERAAVKSGLGEVIIVASPAALAAPSAPPQAPAATAGFTPLAPPLLPSAEAPTFWR